ncbi:cation:proton antiporter, partial [Planktotalea sp.]|uniref:cation:proton antiporter domain-containing protein n=1 Tax=Planktotalea sp. TaxID=2029877 RepID=UPI0025F791D2
LGLGSVLGYLIAGIIISPILALLHVDVIAIQHFAEFGVVMMLFLVGLELEPKMLWAMRAKLLGLGGGQVGLTTLVVMGACMAFGQPWSIALAIGLVMALSSTAIVLQTLNEKGLMKSDGGQSSFSVLLTQDIAVIPMLALLPLLAMPELMGVAGDAAHAVADHASEGDHGPAMSLVDGLNGWQTMLVTVGAVIAVILGGSFLTSPIFRFIAGAGLRELFVAGALLIVIGIALLMSLVGLSPALGTFIAGVVLANSAYRHELESDIDPFRGLLLGLFFMSVGAGINFALLFANLGSIVGMTLGLIAVKASVLLVLARIFKIEEADKWLFALGLAQAEEFGFVLLSFTVAGNIIPSGTADILLLVVALSMLLTPALFIIYDRLIAPRYVTGETREADKIEADSNIIITGHGRVGGMVARVLRASGHTPTVIDYSFKQLDMLERFGVKAYFGDASRPDLLHAAGIHDAKLIAIDNKEQITEMVHYIHTNHPNVHIMARATDRNHVYELYAAGCRDIIRETYDSSLRMVKSAFVALGVPYDKASDMVDVFDESDRAGMIEVADTYDVNISHFESEAFMAKIREVAPRREAEVREQMTQILQRNSKGEEQL